MALSRILNLFKIYIIISISALVLIVAALPPQPVNALNPFDYFNISYETSISRTQVIPGQTFDITVTGTAVCTKDLPFSPGDAVITGRVVAHHEEGEQLILVSSYTVNMSGFPTEEGDSMSASKTLSVNIPSGNPYGVYELHGELIEAKVQIVVWFNVNSYLPSTEDFGSIALVNPSPPPTDTPSPEPVVPQPAPPPTDTIANGKPSFNISNFTLNSTIIDINNSLTISARVNNNGTASGSYQLDLKLDDILLESKTVTLEAGESTVVEFTSTLDQPGTYIIKLNNLSASILVKNASTTSPTTGSDNNQSNQIINTDTTTTETDLLTFLVFGANAALLLAIIGLIISRKKLKT